MNRLFYLLVSIFMLTSLIGCDDTITADDLDKREIPATNVSFKEHIQPIFQIKCNMCHDDASRAGGLSLTTWVSTTSDPGTVFPSEPQNSRLVWAIEGQGGTSVMPPLTSGIKLTSKQILGIKQWIKEGALNN
ncbi:MAG: c-type cytochrome domain-containing protein [Ignavibacteria bacterium]|nr:c-type cytochrome domain-containing protein [Ignavibacteria bacterium]